MQKALARLALIGLAASFVTGCVGGPSRPSERFDAKPLLTGEPKFSSATDALRMAESLRLAGADVEALAVLAAASRRYPRDAAVLSAYGRLALAMGHDELAGRVLETALAANPSDWRALSAQGVLELRGGRTEDARGTLIRARSVSAEDSAVLNNLGISYLLEGRAGEAASVLRQALASPSLKPAHARRIRRNLAVALAVAGNFAEADGLAEATMPRTLQGAKGGAIRRYMGISEAVAARGGWAARLADAPAEPGLAR